MLADRLVLLQGWTFTAEGEGVLRPFRRHLRRIPSTALSSRSRQVECSFKYLLHEDCRAHMQLTDLAAHNDSMVQIHLNLLSTTCDRLTAENLELLERTTRSERMVEEPKKWYELELQRYLVENSRLTEELKSRPPSTRHFQLPSQDFSALPFPSLVPLPGLGGPGSLGNIVSGAPKRRRGQSFSEE